MNLKEARTLGRVITAEGHDVQLICYERSYGLSVALGEGGTVMVDSPEAWQERCEAAAFWQEHELV